MSDIRQRPAGKAGRGSGAENVRAGRAKQTRPTCHRPASIFIQIDEQYAVGADAHAWHILERHRYKGGYRWEPIAWYATAEQCVNGLADRAVRTCGAQTLVDALAESKLITSAICGALRPRFKVGARS